MSKEYLNDEEWTWYEDTLEDDSRYDEVGREIPYTDSSERYDYEPEETDIEDDRERDREYISGYEYDTPQQMVFYKRRSPYVGYYDTVSLFKYISTCRVYTKRRRCTVYTFCDDCGKLCYATGTRWHISKDLCMCLPF